MSAQVIGRDKLGVLSKIGQGGQGVVYRAPNVTTKFAASMVYKEYKPQVLAGIDFTALAAMPALVEESLSYAEAERLIAIAAWPCRIVENNTTPTGFVMPAIPDGFVIELSTARGATATTAEFQHLLNHPSVLAARGIDLDDVQRCTLLREVASGLAFLHKHGVCVGDISPKNLLFCLQPQEAIYFIDCDAIRINGVSALPQVETPGWEIPRGEELATIYSDTYKLGLLALRLLAGDQDTKNLHHLPSTTPTLLRQIITDTLSNDPQQRPLPEAWSYVLGHAIEEAQHHKLTTPPAPPPAGAAPPPPPTPIVHSRPPASRPSGPPPPPPYSTPPVAPPAPAPSRSTLSPSTIWAGVAVVAVVVFAVVTIWATNSKNGTPTTAPQTSYTAPTSGNPYSSAAQTYTTTSPTPVLDPEASSLAQLHQLANDDRSFVRSQLADRWVPQLSSKHSNSPWTYDTEDGVTYDSERTLQEHQRLRQRYNAKLLSSGDWTTFDYPDYWVTVVPITFPTAGSALSWCTSQGLDNDHCSAEMVSTTQGPNGTHAHN